MFEILTAEPLHPRGMAALRSTLLTVEGRPAERRPDADIPPELDEACGEGYLCRAGACFRVTTGLTPPQDPADAGAGDSGDAGGDGDGGGE